MSQGAGEGAGGWNFGRLSKCRSVWLASVWSIIHSAQSTVNALTLVAFCNEKSILPGMTPLDCPLRRYLSPRWHIVCEAFRTEGRHASHSGLQVTFAEIHVEILSRTVSDFLIGRLDGCRTRRPLGSSGKGSNGAIGAIGRARDRVDRVKVRHVKRGARPEAK